MCVCVCVCTCVHVWARVRFSSHASVLMRSNGLRFSSFLIQCPAPFPHGWFFFCVCVCACRRCPLAMRRVFLHIRQAVHQVHNFKLLDALGSCFSTRAHDLLMFHRPSPQPFTSPRFCLAFFLCVFACARVCVTMCVCVCVCHRVRVCVLVCLFVFSERIAWGGRRRKCRRGQHCLHRRVRLCVPALLRPSCAFSKAVWCVETVADHSKRKRQTSLFCRWWWLVVVGGGDLGLFFTAALCQHWLGHQADVRVVVGLHRFLLFSCELLGRHANGTCRCNNGTNADAAGKGPADHWQSLHARLFCKGESLGNNRQRNAPQTHVHRQADKQRHAGKADRRRQADRRTHTHTCKTRTHTHAHTHTHTQKHAHTRIHILSCGLASACCCVAVQQEQYMAPLGPVIQENVPRVKQFIDELCRVDASSERACMRVCACV